jgi:hypothetical protein
MSLTEDLDSFLRDFGVPVTFGSLSAVGILDIPSEIIAGGMVMTTDYSLTFKTSALTGLGYQSAITVDGAAYTVREVRAQDDGRFSVAYLSKNT